MTFILKLVGFLQIHVHSVLKFQVSRTCFEGGVAGRNFGGKCE